MTLKKPSSGAHAKAPLPYPLTILERQQLEQKQSSSSHGKASARTDEDDDDDGGPYSPSLVDSPAFNLKDLGEAMKSPHNRPSYEGKRQENILPDALRIGAHEHGHSSGGGATASTSRARPKSLEVDSDIRRTSSEMRRGYQKGDIPDVLRVGGRRSAETQRPLLPASPTPTTAAPATHAVVDQPSVTPSMTKTPASDNSLPAPLMAANISKTDVPFAEYSPFYNPPPPPPVPSHELPEESTSNSLEPQPQRPQIVSTNSTGSQQRNPSIASSIASTQFDPGADLSSFDASYTRALPGLRGAPAPGMQGWQEVAEEEAAAKTWEEDLERRARAGAELQKRAEEARRREQEETLQQEFWDQERKEWDQQAGIAAPTKPPKQMVVGSGTPIPPALSANNPWNEQISSTRRASEAAAAAQASTSVPSEGVAPPMAQDTSRGRTPMNPETEIYQIKHVNLISPGERECHRVPILLQNANGPCPLMALVNAITLARPISNSTLTQVLAKREQISLSLLLQVVFEELMTYSQGLPDIGDLYAFLMTLHTGMNVNPRFDMPPDSIGDFESTREYGLYGSFNVPLVHGWLAEPNSATATALARSAKTYDESMTLLFAEEEVISRVTSSNAPEPSAQDQTLLADAALVRSFVESSATQLTHHGLSALQRYLPDDKLSILFRNDHFSTVVRRGHDIFTLVTDMGFASHEEVVWERIGDVSGRDNQFLSGDFMPVGGSSSSSVPRPPPRQQQQQITSLLDPAPVPPPRTSSATHNNNACRIPTPPPNADEDYDLALAIQLQEEENARSVPQSQSHDTGRRPSVPAEEQPPPPPTLPPRGRGEGVNTNRPANPEEFPPPPYERVNSQPINPAPATGRRPMGMGMHRRAAGGGSAPPPVLAGMAGGSVGPGVEAGSSGKGRGKDGEKCVVM